MGCNGQIGMKIEGGLLNHTPIPRKVSRIKKTLNRNEMGQGRDRDPRKGKRYPKVSIN
jgi:hypothetical protein